MKELVQSGQVEPQAYALPPGLQGYIVLPRDYSAEVQGEIDALVRRMQKLGITGLRGGVQTLAEFNSQMLAIESSHAGPAIDVVATPVKRRLQNDSNEGK